VGHGAAIDQDQVGLRPPQVGVRNRLLMKIAVWRACSGPEGTNLVQYLGDVGRTLAGNLLGISIVTGVES
jgi:hypothetical protein